MNQMLIFYDQKQNEKIFKIYFKQTYSLSAFCYIIKLFIYNNKTKYKNAINFEKDGNVLRQQFINDMLIDWICELKHRKGELNYANKNTDGNFKCIFSIIKFHE